MLLNKDIIKYCLRWFEHALHKLSHVIVYTWNHMRSIDMGLGSKTKITWYGILRIKKVIQNSREFS